MLFQIRQRYNEDDFRSLQSLHSGQSRDPDHRLNCFLGGVVLTAVFIAYLCLTQIFGERIFLLRLMLPVVSILTTPFIAILFRSAFPPRADKRSLKNAQELTIDFGEDGFEVKNSAGVLRYSYAQVDKFLEKDEHFFLYISQQTAYVLRKSCFTTGDPEDFGPFMREKYRTKDMEPTEKGL